MRLSIGFGTALTIALLWSGIWFHLKTVRADHIVEAEHTATNFARAFEEHIVRTIKGIDQALLQMRGAYAANPSRFDFEATMRQDEALTDLVIGMSLINRDGVVVWASMASQPDLYLGDREHFRFHADGGADQLFIGKPVVGRISGRLSVLLSRRIVMSDGSFGGVAAISLDPAYLSNFYNAIDIGPAGIVAVFGTDGYLRARPSRGHLELGQDWRQLAVLRAQAQAPNGMVHSVSAVDGVSRIIAYRTLPALPLVVAVAVSQADALAQYEHQKQSVLLAGMILTVLFGALAWLLIRQVAAHAHVEAELRRAKEEAESANIAKSEFLANVSHELRTPLNAVIGFSEVMRDALMGPIDNRYREYAQDIHESGQHLLRLIGDVLDLSKIGAGRLELHDEPVDLAQLVQACHRLLAERARDSKVALEVDIARDLPVLMADPVRLKQIVLNLMSNAVKFTPEGGRVTARAAPDADGGATITIADTGIGMTAQEIVVALEPFRQVDNAMTRRYEGSGLGLPLAKQLTELHGGKLELTSEPGVGTTTRVRLPQRRVLRQVDLVTGAQEARGLAKAGGAERE
ncbi:MAG: two-component sensor histidine kinase [Proteobacteria bacterium]|nr:two-component sensor histidine kinase [Pseudomonadota bacterium]